MSTTLKKRRNHAAIVKHTATLLVPGVSVSDFMQAMLDISTSGFLDGYATALREFGFSEDEVEKQVSEMELVATNEIQKGSGE